MKDLEQSATPVEQAAWNGQETARASVDDKRIEDTPIEDAPIDTPIDDAAEAVSSKTDTAKAKAMYVTEKVAAGVSIAADKVAQAAADPEKRHAAQTAVKAQIRRNPWLAAFGVFVMGLRLGRKLPRR